MTTPGTPVPEELLAHIKELVRSLIEVEHPVFLNGDRLTVDTVDDIIPGDLLWLPPMDGDAISWLASLAQLVVPRPL